MPTIKNPNMQVILRCEFGRYEWWPVLQKLDFIEPKCRDPLKSITLNVESNTIEKATRVAIEHLHWYTRRIHVSRSINRT